MNENVIPLERVERRAAALVALEERLEEARALRDNAIRQALAAGHTVREIAAVAGVHYSYVSRIGGRKEDPR